VRIVSWNVNSMKARLPRLLTWLAERQPDVVVLQETKSGDDTWPAFLLEQHGYQSAHLGSGAWNGVAVLSRLGLDDLSYGLSEQPSFDGRVEPRAIAATIGGVRLWSVYVPNGRGLDKPHYAYKLLFLECLAAQVAAELDRLGEAHPFAVLGDFNVAPADDDVWDVAAFDGLTHVSPPERSALDRVLDAGPGEPLQDLVPRASFDPADQRHPYTFWEMRRLGFQKGRGMRIDLALVNSAFRNKVIDAWVDRDTRKGVGPSDHAPLVLDLN
jgi:exodeoxyribonuclease-3